MAQSHSSPMSITQLCNNGNEEHDHQRQRRSSAVSSTSSTYDYHPDPDVQLAAEALGDMAKAKTTVPTSNITLPPLSTYASAPSTSPSSPLPTPTSSSLSNNRLSFSSELAADDDPSSQPPQHFMNRVSNFPLVNSALRAYETTKHSNGVVKYGVEMVESFAGPIYDKFGRRAPSESPELEERCRQLAISGPDPEDEAAVAAATALAQASLSDEPRDGFRRRRAEEPRDDKTVKKTRSRPASRSTSPHRPYSLSQKSTTAVRHHPTPIPRSRWQQIVMHAGSAAGTTAAVISEESMKCLRYCLSWLQYAMRHIEQQMDILRNFLVSLATQGSKNKRAQSKSDSQTVAVPSSASSTLNAVKKEIIDTLRKVVDVISKYAGSGLPEQAKASVRSFILALPGRWAALNTSTTTSPVASPAIGPQVHETSIKLLNFGDESIEMLGSVSGVFSDTIERAELWLERLRVVRGSQSSSRRPSSTKQTPPEETTEMMDTST